MAKVKNLWAYGEWYFKCIIHNEALKKKLAEEAKKNLPPPKLTDFSVRRVGEDRWESFNIHSKKRFMTACSEDEAWRDLHEEFKDC